MKLRPKTLLSSTLLFSLLLAGLVSNVSAQQTDSASGLVLDEGWQLVNENCTECHSSALVTQNSGTRDVWLSRIRWMQDTQGLKLLEPTLENSILDYLASNYGAKSASRRSALPAASMPTNPYEVAD